MAYDKAAYEKYKPRVIARQRERRRETKRWFKEEVLANAKCIKCGESHIGCLDLHHRDPKEKEFGLGYIAQKNITRKRILKEVTKCDILCANCHRKLHYEESLKIMDC